MPSGTHKALGPWVGGMGPEPNVSVGGFEVCFVDARII